MEFKKIDFEDFRLPVYCMHYHDSLIIALNTVSPR